MTDTQWLSLLRIFCYQFASYELTHHEFDARLLLNQLERDIKK